MKNVKTFMDFTCPFSYIGFSILQKLKSEEKGLEYTWYPYELNEDTPLEGKDISDKFSGDGLDEGFKRITDLGDEYGLEYKNNNMAYNTGRAHRAALFARDSGKLDEFAGRVFKAIFEEGRNVAEKEVLNDIGLKVGLNIVEMNRCIDDGGYDEEMEEAKKMASVYEVESVPTFIVDEERKVTDLKPYAEFKKDLQGK